jgi:hypothetical protein
MPEPMQMNLPAHLHACQLASLAGFFYPTVPRYLESSSPSSYGTSIHTPCISSSVCLSVHSSYATLADATFGLGWIGERTKSSSVFADDYLNRLLCSVTGAFFDTLYVRLTPCVSMYIVRAHVCAMMRC